MVGAAARRLRHRNERPSGVWPLRALLPGVSVGRGSGRGEGLGEIAVLPAGGEAGENLAEAAEAVDEEGDQRMGQKIPGAARGHCPAQRLDDGGKVFGRGLGWRVGHVKMLV